MDVEELSLPGAKLVAPPVYRDARGFFTETWNRRTLAGAGIDADFVQDNHSMSVQEGTIRGMHFQAPPHGQAKLVRCPRGRVWDVIVDIRRGSPTYGKWEGIELSAANGRQLFVPEGFLHGFLTLTAEAEVAYKCTDFYAPQADGSVRWDSIGIDWPVTGTPLLSEKDRAAPAFADFETPFVWEAMQ